METYEKINLEDYIQTGEGGTALTYNHKEGKTLAKLFMPGMGAEQAEREFKVNQVVYDMGLPTPRPIRLITDGTRNLWIDVGDFAYGCPEWDLCTLFFTTHNLTEDKADEYFHLTPDVLKKQWDIFASVYFETADPEVLQSKEKLLYHFFALHLLYVIGKTNNAFGAPIDYVVKQVNSYLLH